MRGKEDRVEMNDDNVKDSELKTCVVLGGRGLIGRSLVGRLLKLGQWFVRVADSTPELQLDDSSSSDSLLSQALASDRASYFQVDVRNKDEIVRAVNSSVVVFFTDTTDSYAQDFCFCYSTIVQGVKNVISACRESKVKRLIFNSPADVVCDGAENIHNGDEALPYAGKFSSTLTDLKVQAEALVLFANDIGGLSTCVVRYSNVFGPGDKLLLPSIVKVAKSYWAKYFIGSGESIADFTYVENVAHANICVEEALTSKMVSVSGKVFFVTNLEPMKFWEFVYLVLDGLGYDRPMLKLPAIVLKYLFLLLKLMKKEMEYTSTHNMLSLSLCTRTFNCSAAQKQIGYSPIVPLEEGVAMTLPSFSHLAQDSILNRNGHFSELSKASAFLGNGKVADILLWRDEKKTFSTFLVLVLLYGWFFLLGRTFVSSLSGLLLLIIVLLTGYGLLPPNISGLTISRIPSSYFEISEADIEGSISSAAYVWNTGCHLLESLAHGEDWSTLLRVISFLYVVKLVSHSLTAAIGIVLVLAFMVFYIYEQYEEEIDGATNSGIVYAQKAVGWLSSNIRRPLESYLPDSEPREQLSNTNHRE